MPSAPYRHLVKETAQCAISAILGYLLLAYFLMWSYVGGDFRFDGIDADGLHFRVLHSPAIIENLTNTNLCCLDLIVAFAGTLENPTELAQFLTILVVSYLVVSGRAYLMYAHAQSRWQAQPQYDGVGSPVLWLLAILFPAVEIAAFRSAASDERERRNAALRAGDRFKASYITLRLYGLVLVFAAIRAWDLTIGQALRPRR